MNKSILLVPIFALFFFSACMSPPNSGGPIAKSTMSEQWASGHFVVSPMDSGLVVIGVSGRDHSRRDNDVSDAEIEAAREDAARKVAMFHGMKVSVEFLNRAGGSVLQHIAEREVSLETGDHARFVEQLTFNPAEDVLVFQRGTLVRFRYPASVTPVSRIGGIGSDGRPEWINSRNLPRIDGHNVAVGFSQNQVQFRDTVMKSMEATVAGLVANTETVIETSIEDVQGQSSVTYIRSKSEGDLTGFRVLEFWIDPANMSVYTLGIARNN